ncbi:VOC family protein [Nocardioides sp. MAH-18]|uniref:VOC family protein n=1 Tax=Nocardioides agri TaxID=2682843 RepID=A0A6L6XWF4_9ACTN|nr:MULTISPECIES: VOC family protein [unclassified Nocardioides]MBA2952558.1 VOC family protein [Nocardioides sp. CGMCC 1.13656]MVQ51721.1 VOC family protein [Nocardioides sp. MAH-18]
MEIDLFAGVPVTDYARSVAWMERLLGRPADFVAHETECVWDVAEHRSVYVVQYPEHAGHTMLMLFLSDLEGHLAEAAGRGLEPDRIEVYGAVRKAVFLDPDGNEIGLGGMV